VDYYFEIIYYINKFNNKTNTLTRRENKIRFQNNIKTEYIYIFFRKDQVDPRVLENLGISFININVTVSRRHSRLAISRQYSSFLGQ
jgi:hypothetical protein